MEQEYNWDLILKTAVPISLAEGYIFYANLSDIWRWLALVIGLILAGAIVYMNGRKKSDTFTAIGIVFLVFRNSYSGNSPYLGINFTVCPNHTLDSRKGTNLIYVRRSWII